MSVRIKGTTDLLEVDADGRALVNTPLVDIEAGFSAMIGENDAGSVTGDRRVRSMEISSDFRVRTGQDNMIFNETFVGAAFNTGLWQTTVSAMTTAVANGYAVLNNSLVLTSGATAMLRTYRHFPCYKQFTTYAEIEVNLQSAPVLGSICEWGLFLASGVATPTDGAFFRLDQVGEFKCVMNYNGVETESASLPTSLIGVGETKTYLVYVGSASVQFWIDNILVSEIFAPNGQGSAMSSMNLPLSFRVRHSAATTVAQVMKIGNTNVTFGDQALSKQWGHVMTGAGGASSQGQTGATLGSTANYTNAAASAGAALVNISAAAQFTGLGGIFNVLPTLAVGSDGILCSYQVPLGTSILPGKSLYITSLTVESVVTTALVGGPVIYASSLAYGHTAVSLATTESATTKAPRRQPLGIQSFPATSVVGTIANENRNDFSAAPIVVQPGEFVQVAVRNLGTVTTAGVITYVVAFTGYWE
jgi:hypothetical protein